MSKSLESKIRWLEEKQAEEKASTLLTIKGFHFNKDPEVCRNNPEPRVPDSWCSWMHSKIECWDHTNFGLLPCAECEHFYVRCDGYAHLKIDVQDIIASLLEN